MKYIKKVAVSPIPEINGSVVDTFNVEDKTTNAPSIRAVEEKLSYSAEEKVVGKWFGKPLYRKVITGNMPKTQISGGVYAEYVQTGLSNCKIRNFYGMCHQENGEQSFPFPITNNDNIRNQVQAFFPNCSQLTLTSFFNWNGYIADITLEYTKNTD